MKWDKLGMIFCPNNNFEWMASHASVPFAEPIGTDVFKIYFSARDCQGRSHTSYLIIDITQPHKILHIERTPLLSPGELGTFDDSGAMLSWVVNLEEKKYFYYIGWNLGVTVPFRNSVGLAIADQQGVIQRYAKGAVLDRSLTEPHFAASCCILIEQNVWRMWYLSCIKWQIESNVPKPYYHIKYAESFDGIHWTRNGVICIDFQTPSEHAISRPCVLKDNGLYKMWYSYRGEKYRIGYAESDDGIHWTRLDTQVGIETSKSGWDSEMIEYPFIFDHAGERYMLYNGNGYGKTGFGLAILTHHSV
jgi:hypothetical protein